MIVSPRPRQNAQSLLSFKYHLQLSISVKFKLFNFLVLYKNNINLLLLFKEKEKVEKWITDTVKPRFTAVCGRKKTSTVNWGPR